MPTLGTGKDRETDRTPGRITLGRVARLLRSKGWRTPIRVELHPGDLHEGDVFICLARKNVVEAIPVVGGAPSRTDPLSAKEKGALKRVGLHPSSSDVIEKSIKEAVRAYAAFINDSLTVEKAAEHLEVNESRIRQRLGGDPASLYGIKHVEGWRLPKFQFDKKGEIPGLSEVVAALSPDLDAVSVCQWFLTPNRDLTLPDGETHISPRDWLRLRRPPSVVGELARNL